MPRKKLAILDNRQEEDATVQSVLDAVTSFSEESLSRQDEGNDIDLRILRGNETHVWDNEILLEGEG